LIVILIELLVFFAGKKLLNPSSGSGRASCHGGVFLFFVSTIIIHRGIAK
jgi:hypothetical protein